MLLLHLNFSCCVSSASASLKPSSFCHTHGHSSSSPPTLTHNSYTWLDPEACTLVDMQLTNLETGQSEPEYPRGFWQDVVQVCRSGCLV